MRLIPERVLGLPDEALRRLQAALGLDEDRQERRVWHRPGRAHVEVRAVHRPEGSEVARALRKALEALDGVDWAEVNPILARAVIAYDEQAVSLEDLLAVIEDVEDVHGVSEEGFPRERADHPGDTEPLRRAVISLGADAAGLGLGGLGWMLRLPRVPPEVGAAGSVLESVPGMREALDRRPAAEVAVVAGSAVLQALAQGPLGLVVDASHRTTLLGELLARRRAWETAEPELHPGPRDERLEAVEGLARPAPLRPGLVELYGQNAPLASLGLGALTAVATRDPRRSVDMLLAGVTRAARLGREGFAAQVGRDLASRGVVTMDSRALRLLDRVDTLVVDTEALESPYHSIDRTLALPGEEPEVVDERARMLFDPEEPRRPAERRGWSLGPLADIPRPWPRGAVSRSDRLSKGGALVLGLRWKGALVGLLAASPELDPAALLLVGAARSAGAQVVQAGASTPQGDQLEVDRRVPGGERLSRSVRQLQKEGRVVALVSRRPGEALVAADCGLGVLGAEPGEPPWGADLLCPTVAEAAPVIEAVGLARAASRQSVMLAGAGSALASLFALSPLPGSNLRALATVHIASLAAIGTGTWTGTRLPRLPASRHRPRVAWHALEASDVMAQLGASPGGLDDQEARSRRAPTDEYRAPSLLAVTAAELANPVTAILAGGAAMSAAVGSVTDAALVGGAMGLNAVLGAAQRVRAERSLERLTAAVTSGTMLVKRGGSESPAGVRDLVPGDTVLLRAGDAVVADCRVVDSVALEADESAMTGESLPVAKSADPVGSGAAVADRSSMLYAGTAVAAGRGTAVVVATGPDTEASTASAATGRPPPTGVDARLGKLTRLAFPVVLGAGAGLTLNGLARGRSVRESVGAGVSLATAAVPEGLPFIATVAQASAGNRLARRGVLVRNPRVLEALGRVDTLCFDKTGTLTEGRLRVQRVSDGESDQAVDALGTIGRDVLAAALRATPRPRDRDLPHATDQAVVDSAVAAGVQHDLGVAGWRKVSSLPFEAGRAFHSVLASCADGPILSVKGAPEAVLPRCRTWRNGPEGSVPLGRVRAELDAEVERLSGQGLRVLAVAEGPGPTSATRTALKDSDVAGLELLGFIGIADLARSSAASPIAELIEAGINVAMVTGDHPSTARAIAAELGLLNGRRVLSGTDIDDLSDDELREVIDDVSVFARVTPADKVRIVKAFQGAGDVVAMTGDGTNDAQAIRLADVGIAFGERATAAAREASDLVVLQDGVEALVDSIAEGRAMWYSVRNALALLLGGNLGEIAFTAGTALITGDPPLSARQMLTVNLFTDLLPAMAIAIQPPAGNVDIGREGPDTSLGGILGREVAVRAGATAAGAGGAWLAARLTGTTARARTVALAALVGSQLGQTIVAGRNSPLVVVSSVAASGALVAVIQTPGLSQFFGCRPLGPLGWAIAAGASGAATGASVLAMAALSGGGGSTESYATVRLADTSTTPS